MLNWTTPQSLIEALIEAFENMGGVLSISDRYELTRRLETLWKDGYESGQEDGWLNGFEAGVAEEVARMRRETKDA